jgi:hypothetical protein
MDVLHSTPRAGVCCVRGHSWHGVHGMNDSAASALNRPGAAHANEKQLSSARSRRTRPRVHAAQPCLLMNEFSVHSNTCFAPRPASRLRTGRPDEPACCVAAAARPATQQQLSRGPRAHEL